MGQCQRTIDYDRIAAEYALHRKVHPGVLEDLFNTAGLTASSTVVEVGCGTANYLVALESLAACSCWGLDPSEEMLARARPRSARIRFQQGIAEELPLPAEAFDLVFSVDVIHHMTNRPAYFREAHRVLTAGGKVSTVTDSEWIIRHREPLTVYFPDTVDVELIRYPSTTDLLEAMASVGFRDIEERMREFPYELNDPQPYRDKAFSSLHLIPEEAFRQGVARMEQDLAAGPIRCMSRYVLVWGTK